MVGGDTVHAAILLLLLLGICALWNCMGEMKAGSKKMHKDVSDCLCMKFFVVAMTTMVVTGARAVVVGSSTTRLMFCSVHPRNKMYLSFILVRWSELRGGELRKKSFGVGKGLLKHKDF